VSLKTGSGQIVTSTTKAGNVVYEFKKDLKRGDKSEDVFNLQSILAKDNTVYPEGVVNGVFDLPTYKAVIRFQKLIGVSPQSGIVDYKTREYLNQSYSGEKSATISSGGFSFNSNLKLGDGGAEVKELQRILAEDPAIYPEGRLTGKFDLLLKKALERFQTKYTLQVTGEFDTPTRTQLNNLLNKKTDDNKLSPGVTASLAFSVFNNANASFKNISLVGFLCNSDMKVVAISKSQSEISAQKSKNFVLS
jgi:peptidoglycan hydrolase-like protein with peptidoglycan-binding domain